MNNQNDTKHLANIQALRAIAAILVVFGHTFVWAAQLPGALELTVNRLNFLGGCIGYAGVDLFFVISGVIVTLAAVASGESTAYRGRFLASALFVFRRIMRIYPIYWIAFAISAFADQWWPMTPAPWVGLATPFEQLSLTTLYTGPVQQAWSMTYEVFFYAVLTIGIFIAPKRLFVFISAWMAVEAWIIFEHALAGDKGLYIWFGSYILEFGFGALIAFLIKRRIFLMPSVLILIGLGFFSLGAYLTSLHGLIDAFSKTWTFGVGCALIVYGLVVLEQRRKFVFPRMLQKIGDASYSIYLFQYLVIIGGRMFVLKTGIYPTVSPTIIGTVWFFSAIAIGMLCYRYLELPLIRFTRAITSPPARRSLENAS